MLETEIEIIELEIEIYELENEKVEVLNALKYCRLLNIKIT